MTSFWSYVAEGSLLLGLALWWLVNTCVDIMKTQHGNHICKARMTHPWPGTNIPVEIIYKLFLAAFGFFGELASAGGQFYDGNGNFQNMTKLMYLSIYGIFLLHSVFDILLWLEIPLIKGSNYASAATGFFWYALALFSWAGDFEEEKVGLMIRTLPAYLLFPVGLAFALESLWRSGFLLPVVRAFCLQTYATWCIQSACILHVHNAFPGTAANPNWDLNDHRNVSMIGAIFGLHLCCNLVLIAGTYTLIAAILRMRLGLKVDNRDDMITAYGNMYSPMSSREEVERESTVKLLSAYSS